MPTQDEIKRFFLSNPSADEVAAARAAHPEVTNADIASAMQVSEADVKRVLDTNTGGALPSDTQNTGVNVARNPMGGEPTGGSQSNPALDIPRQQSADEWATQQGYTPTEDGSHFISPDGESRLNREQIEQIMPDYGATLAGAGFIPVGAGGLTQETIGWLNNNYGTNFSDPTDYYRYVYGGGSVVDDPETGMQLFRMPGNPGDPNFGRAVNPQLSYTPSPTWADYAFPAAFGILLGAGVTGMLPGTTSLFGGAAAGGGVGGGGLLTAAEMAELTGLGASTADIGVLSWAGSPAGIAAMEAAGYTAAEIAAAQAGTAAGPLAGLPPGAEQFPAPVQEGPTTPGTGPNGSLPPLSPTPPPR